MRSSLKEALAISRSSFRRTDEGLRADQESVLPRPPPTRSTRSSTSSATCSARQASPRTIARVSRRSRRSASRCSKANEEISARADRDVLRRKSCKELQLERLRWSLKARLRSRAALPQEIRRGGRQAGGLPLARRPGEVPVHHQGGPARQLSVRPVRRAAATRWCASTPRPARPASRRWSATRAKDIDTWSAGDGALDPRRRRAPRRQGACRLRLRPVHRRPGRALRRRAARPHRRSRWAAA